jgi:hypothetical protein
MGIGISFIVRVYQNGGIPALKEKMISASSACLNHKQKINEKFYRQFGLNYDIILAGLMVVAIAIFVFTRIAVCAIEVVHGG